MLLTNKLTVYLQTISDDSQFANRDSLKCFTYKEARKIITDLRQLPVKDSIINRLDSINSKSEIIILRQSQKVTSQRLEIFDKSVKIEKLKRHKRILFIFGALLGLATQLIF